MLKPTYTGKVRVLKLISRSVRSHLAHKFGTGQRRHPHGDTLTAVDPGPLTLERRDDHRDPVHTAQGHHLRLCIDGLAHRRRPRHEGAVDRRVHREGLFHLAARLQLFEAGSRHAQCLQPLFQLRAARFIGVLERFEIELLQPPPFGRVNGKQLFALADFCTDLLVGECDELAGQARFDIGHARLGHACHPANGLNAPRHRPARHLCGTHAEVVDERRGDRNLGQACRHFLCPGGGFFLHQVHATDRADPGLRRHNVGVHGTDIVRIAMLARVLLCRLTRRLCAGRGSIGQQETLDADADDGAECDQSQGYGKFCVLHGL